MNKLKLTLNLLDAIENNKQIQRKFIIALSSAKYITENSEGYMGRTLNWSSFAESKETMKELFNEIHKECNLALFADKDINNVLKSINNDYLQKIINMINEIQSDESLNSIISEYRLLANIDWKLAQFVTPDSLLEVPLKILEIKNKMTIIDPFNGESGVLVALNKLKNNDIKYYGEEISKDVYEIGSLIAYLIDKNQVVIRNIDSFNELPKDIKEEEIKFDLSISALPFINTAEKINKNIVNYYKELDLKNIKSYWLPALQGLYHLNESGKAAFLLPAGTLFSTSKSDKEIKKYLLNKDYIEAIVKVPEGILAPYSYIQVYWVIFNKKKEDSRKNKIRFIDISKYIEDIDRRSKAISKEGLEFLEVEFKKEIVNTKLAFDLDLISIIENNCNLDGFEYIKRKEVEADILKGNKIELKEVATIRRGIQLNKSRLDVLNNEEHRTHYVVGLANVNNNRVILDETTKIAVEDRWINLYELQEGDIVLTTKGSVFKMAIVDKNIKNAIISANLSLIRLDKEKYDPVVLKYYLDSRQGRKLIEALQKGSSMIKSLAVKDLETALIPNINIEKQRELSKLIINNEAKYLERISFAEDVYEEGKEKINCLMEIE